MPVMPAAGRKTTMQRSVAAVVLCAILMAASGCIAFPRVAHVSKVRGRVVSAVDQAPLSGVLVTADWSFWSEAVGHGSTHSLAFDYRLTDTEGRFAFPGKVFCFMHVEGIMSIMSTSLDEVGLTTFAGPLYRGSSKTHSPQGETVISKDLDEMQTGQVNWPITPVNVAKNYLAYYGGMVQIADLCARKTGGAKHPQYQRLLQFREEMERKAAEWRERLRTAQDHPVYEKPPPP
jgi:hypothetical protein